MVDAAPPPSSPPSPAPAPSASGPTPPAKDDTFKKEVEKKKAAASGGAPSVSGDVKVPEVNSLAAMPSGDGKPAPRGGSGTGNDNGTGASGGAPSAKRDDKVPGINTLAAAPSGGNGHGASGGAPGSWQEEWDRRVQLRDQALASGDQNLVDHYTGELSVMKPTIELLGSGPDAGGNGTGGDVSASGSAASGGAAPGGNEASGGVSASGSAASGGAAPGGNGASGDVSASGSAASGGAAPGGDGASGDVSASGSAASGGAAPGGNGASGDVSASGSAASGGAAPGGNGASGDVSASGSAASGGAAPGGDGASGDVSASGSAASGGAAPGGDGASGDVSASGSAASGGAAPGGDGASGPGGSSASGSDVVASGRGGRAISGSQEVASGPDEVASGPDEVASGSGGGDLDTVHQTRIAQNKKIIESVGGKGGEEVIQTLEDIGYISFEGNLSEEVRKSYIELFDKSPFFERYILDYFANRSGGRGLTVGVQDTEGSYGLAYGNYRIELDDDLFKGSSASLPHVIAHETLHIAGFGHSAGQDTAMAVFASEFGMFEKGVSYKPEYVGNSFDYDLFMATKKDWDSVGATVFENTDAYNSGLQKLFGTDFDSANAGLAFSTSSQSFKGDTPSIAKAYLNALDGGEVEKLRAKQLTDLGVNVEALKGTDGHLNYLASYYHEYISIPNRTVPSLTGEAQGMFENMLQHYYIFENPKGDNNDAVTWVLDQINSRLPGTYPDGEANTYWDERDDGVEATVILNNYYNKHSGGDTLRDLAQSVRKRMGMG